MKNLSILLILVFGFLLSCSTDADVETNVESSEEVRNDEFLEEISKNEAFLKFVELKEDIENVIIQALESHQISPDEFRQMYINKDQQALELLFKNTQLVELSIQSRMAAETVLSQYPDIQRRLDSFMTDNKDENDQEITLFPFLDQKNQSYKCNTVAGVLLTRLCELTFAAVGVGCAVWVAPTGAGVVVCVLSASALGYNCQFIC